VKRPECIRTLLAAFPSTNEAGAAVSDIIAAGMLPAAIEMMDNLAIQAAEAAVHANYPSCGGLLLVELDGPVAEVEALIATSRRFAVRMARRKFAWRSRTQNARSSGRDARRFCGDGPASRPTTSSRMASFRAQLFPK